MILGTSLAMFAQTGTLTVKYIFIGVEDGYDHLCKTQVWIDGEMVGESPEVKQTKGSTFTVEVPTGKHEYRIVNLALYEGKWEEHLISNDYSIDCVDEGTHNFKAKNKVFYLYDLDSEMQVNWKKMPKKSKK